MEFNEQEAIKFIRTRLSQEANERCSDDELLNVIDMIWDFYEDNGLLDISADLDEDDEDVIDTERLLAYVRRLVAKDKKSPLTPEDVETVVMAELEYENTLEEE